MVELRDATAHDSEAVAALHADSWRRNYRGAFPDAYLDGEVFADRRAVWTERLREAAADAFTVVAEVDGARRRASRTRSSTQIPSSARWSTTCTSRTTASERGSAPA